MIFNNLISKLSTNLLLAVIGVLFGAVVLLAIDNYFTSSSLDSTKKDLTKKEVELTNAQEALTKAEKTYEKNLALQTEIAKQKAITQEAKKEVTKATSKVQEELIKRGEIKHDENENDFIIVEF